jgi:CPA2 family monovalent cation:H+ antiporter-2
VLAALMIVMIGKSIAAFVIVLAFGRPMTTAFTISASLAQIGEFSFILATLGLSLKLLPEAGRDLILASAILSIMANPALFVLVDRYVQKKKSAAPAGAAPEPPALVPTALAGHAVLIGYGRVGRAIGEGLKRTKLPFVVVETNLDIVVKARSEGIEAQCGNAAEPALLAAANVAAARLLFVAIPIAFEAGQIIEQARRANPALKIVARAHFDAEVAHLTGFGADSVVMGEREIAAAMVRQAFPEPGAAPAAA